MKKSLNALENLLDFLARLDEHKIWYRLEHVRDSIMVITMIPGEYWEIEFFADGHIEIEKFTSKGEIQDDLSLLDEFIKIMTE
jgi:hypothetical protein